MRIAHFGFGLLKLRRGLKDQNILRFLSLNLYLKLRRGLKGNPGYIIYTKNYFALNSEEDWKSSGSGFSGGAVPALNSEEDWKFYVTHNLIIQNKLKLRRGLKGLF